MASGLRSRVLKTNFNDIVPRLKHFKMRFQITKAKEAVVRLVRARVFAAQPDADYFKEPEQLAQRA